MGKKRRQRLSGHISNYNKYTLTEKQVGDLVNRIRIAQMHKLGHNRSEIKKEVGVTWRAIDKWKSLTLNDPVSFIDKPRTGRTEIPREIERKVLRKRKSKHFSTREASAQLGISHVSVKNILNDAEAKWKTCPKATRITAEHKKARLRFCKEHYQKDLSWFDKILMTDSKMFTLQGGRNPKHQGRWVFSCEEVEEWGAEKFSPSLHVYGGMTSRGLTKLVFVNGSVTGERYVTEVLPTLLNAKHRKTKTANVLTTKLFADDNDWIFEQDHATSHDSKMSQDYLDENAPSFFRKEDVPAKLDDVWCIERIWAVMTYQVYGKGRRQPKSLAELKRRILRSWKSLDVDMLRKAVHQMPLRMKEIVKRKGSRITQFNDHCDCKLCLK